MLKKQALVAFGLLTAAGVAKAQEYRLQLDTVLVDESKQAATTFIFDEDQLGEDDDMAKATTLVSTQNDPYLREVGYTFSAMRFKIRAYDSQYTGNYFNGVKLNNVENGRFSFSGMTGGLNDAVRNSEGLTSFDRNDWGYTSMGGGSNVNLRASSYRAGHKVGLAGTNRNYVLRGQYSYASGLNKKGWAFMAALAYRWAKPGMAAIDGVFYNSFSYMLGVEKVFNDMHRVSFNTWGAPTERGQQGAATEEAYYLANSHYYNPYWGFQNGKRRNSRVVTEYSPTGLLTWDFTPSKTSKLTTTAAFSYVQYASTALSYNNAYNPMPTYYKNFPSSIVNMYEESGIGNNYDTWMGNPGLLHQYNALVSQWSTEEGRQVQWDKLYAMNEANNQTGKDALYYLEKRHNDQLAFRFASVWSQDVDDNKHLNAGVHISTTKGMHYKTMDDMLGASQFHDYDSYSVSEFGYGSSEVQNDLDNPSRSIGTGDRFGYDYNIYVNKYQGFINYSLTKGGFAFVWGGDVEGTSIERYGNMRNGRAADYSKGSSGTAWFLGGGEKIALSYTMRNHTFGIAGGYETQAPLAYNSFVAARIQNNFVDNLSNEQIFTTQASWQWRFGRLSGKFTGFWTKNWDVTQQSVAYLDNGSASSFNYLTMTGVEKRYYGLEGAVTLKVIDNLKLNVIGTISDAKYCGNPLAQMANEKNNALLDAAQNSWTSPVTGDAQQLRVIYDGMRVGSTPLTAVSIGLNYNIKRWYFELEANYYDRVYIEASPFTRLGSIMDGTKDNPLYYTNAQTVGIDGSVTHNYDAMTDKGGNVYDDVTGELLYSVTPSQEKAKGGWMMNLSIGKSIYLPHSRMLNINLQVCNFLNNTNLKTGGYEQSRTAGLVNPKSPYRFENNSFYWYANAVNAFLNIGLRF